MPKRSDIPTLLLVLATIAPATSAEAYLRTQTCDPAGVSNRLCNPGELPLPVYWPSPCQTYYLNRQGSNDFGGLSQELELLVQESFTEWSRHECSSVLLEYGGDTCNTNIGREDEDITGGNQNLVIWIEDQWPHSSDAIALTTVSTNPNTGEIQDADIEFNGQYFTFANLANEQDGLMDVKNTLVHEVGHFIGFDHEFQIQEATMYPSALFGEIYKRDLHQDDLNGLCAVYPNYGEQCILPTLSDRTCTVEFTGESDCTHAPGRSPTRGHGLIVAALLGVALYRRRRR